jgi:hypothetical protein
MELEGLGNKLNPKDLKSAAFLRNPQAFLHFPDPVFTAGFMVGMDPPASTMSTGVAAH